jgi:Protein of unknown function, DUF547
MRLFFMLVSLIGMSCQDVSTAQLQPSSSPVDTILRAAEVNTQPVTPTVAPARIERDTVKDRQAKTLKDTEPQPSHSETKSVHASPVSIEPKQSGTNDIAAEAAPTTQKPEVAHTFSEKPSHQQWTALLFKHVSAAGDVSYQGFKQDMDAVKSYLEHLSTNSPQKDWSRNDHMAYWINAYNAATILLVLENYPLKSIQNLDGGKTWDVKRISLGGKKYSLNEIENDILRAKYKDARIHFAVNCAAKSCPPLHNMAFEPSFLNQQLEDRAKGFVRSKKYNTYDGNVVEVSKIFEWYGQDFGDIRQFVNKYLTQQIPEGTQIGFRDYNWALNGN